ncbi:MAG: DUF554 family protein [Anaerolineae bacterium]
MLRGVTTPLGGTLLNMFTVAVGSLIGLLIGNRLSEKIQTSVVTGLGLVTIFVGISNAGKSGNIIVPLLSLVTGVIIGEILDLDGALQRFGGWLQQRFAGKALADGSPLADTDQPARARFITGFVTASLLFCIGPLTFVGSMQDGMGLAIGFQQLAIKSVLDGFAAVAFAASFGAGVSFTLITILVGRGAGQVGERPRPVYERGDDQRDDGRGRTHVDRAVSHPA